MKKSRIKLTLIGLMCFIALSAQRIDTISVYSPKMDVKVKNLVILPASYDNTPSANYAVLYLLHGYGGTYNTWLNNIKQNLPQEASKWNIIIVCPDGKNSWYWDSPINPKSQYETYISQELINYIDTNYKTKKSPAGRAITGLSMGGHGALWLGIRHPELFGACGSMSGGVDIRPFPNNWEIKNLLGTYAENSQVWNNYTVINQVDKIKPNTSEIIIDCGTEDFFYEVNVKLHKKLLQNQIPHEYIVRPGAHNSSYWKNAIDAQLLFFGKFFQHN